MTVRNYKHWFIKSRQTILNEEIYQRKYFFCFAMTYSLPGLAALFLLKNCSHNIFKKHSLSSSCAHKPFFYHKGGWNCDCIDLCDQISTGFNRAEYEHPGSRPETPCRRWPTSFFDHPWGPGVLGRGSHQCPTVWANLWALWARTQARATLGAYCVQLKIIPDTQHPVAALQVSPLSAWAGEVRMKTITVDYSKWLADWKSL